MVQGHSLCFTAAIQKGYSEMLGYEWHDFIGNIGVFCILATYLLVQLERISATTQLYSVLNAIGAALVLFSLFYDFNLSAFVIEAAWLLISLFGIARRLFIGADTQQIQ